jgi:hypothetical protein
MRVEHREEAVALGARCLTRGFREAVGDLEIAVGEALHRRVDVDVVQSSRAFAGTRPARSARVSRASLEASGISTTRI